MSNNRRIRAKAKRNSDKNMKNDNKEKELAEDEWIQSCETKNECLEITADFIDLKK